MSKNKHKVIVLGLDGLEPKIVDAMLAAGELPNLGKLRAVGGYGRVATTYPAQTPVAWSTFSTGTNPGGHGVFDFLRRNPKTYQPDLALYRYEQKNAFSPPRPVNLRRGVPFWNLLSLAGVNSTILRCPCTYPAETLRGRMLSGMGVPDVRGSLGMPTFYTTRHGVRPGESESVVHLAPKGGLYTTSLIGPRSAKTGTHAEAPITLEPDIGSESLLIRSTGCPAALRVALGEWSDWLKIKIKTGVFETVAGMVRFRLLRLEPELELYASPINFDPAAPRFPISEPPDFAAGLERALGTFATTGMVEDHNGLNNERFDEAAYLQQCAQIMAERERMMLHELNRLDEGFFFCLFDTPDRIQHMFWRSSDQPQPIIAEQYRRCDELVGKAWQFVDEKTLFIVLSDHGFNSFERGVHLNSWLHDMGLLRLKSGCRPDADRNFFENVDWRGTKAYALGLAGIYLNIRGREEEGIVPSAEAESLKHAIAGGLSRLHDAERDARPVRSVLAREQVYRGPYTAEAPDLVVNFAETYRVSWATALGGVPAGVFEDNSKKWRGDHIIDPALVPGVLFMNAPFDNNAGLVDLAPTILHAFDVPRGDAMEGRSLLA